MIGAQMRIEGALVRRFARDSLVAASFLFIGLLYATRAWPRVEFLFGALLSAVGALIVLKINISPFTDLSPTATLLAYFRLKHSMARKLWRRASLLFFSIPFIFFMPIIMIVRDLGHMNGYMIITMFMFVTSGYFMVRALISRAR